MPERKICINLKDVFMAKATTLPTTATQSAPSASTPGPTASAKADLDNTLSQQIKSLEQQANAEQQAELTGSQTQWMMPVLKPAGIPSSQGWSGDLFDYKGMAEPFDRSQSNQALINALDASSPGTSGDLIITTLQVDWLACAERAFRARHTMRRPRAVAHAMGRKAGHGSDTGPLNQCVLQYINGLVSESKKTAATGAQATPAVLGATA